ncbi:hypothetical protein C3486_11985 [Streptomyces sp. Ru73]|uniref:hypothetical protein n=1 Tax=Streptomyces sp. Ru73 TaxID=2080748 RepID=UPI000CDD7FE4|nr:hypothetical protein [Streptomyces sp. Ru73]POX40901.1 hypothetical protein C3486_11985 [Streptomyces sp. Ru73]
MDPRAYPSQHGHRPADDASRTRRLGQQERDRAEQPARVERERAAAARRRPPRAKVDLYVNEYSGTVTWRTRMTPAEKRYRSASGPGTRQRSSADDRRRAEAAALRSVGIDPRRSRGSGAAPIPTHPATVLAATHVSVADMTPGQLNAHAARVSALRSQLQGDTARAGRMPMSSAARLRSGLDAARVHSLRVERSASARELAQRHQQPRPLRTEQRQRGAGPAQR